MDGIRDEVFFSESKSTISEVSKATYGQGNDRKTKSSYDLEPIRRTRSKSRNIAVSNSA